MFKQQGQQRIAMKRLVLALVPVTVLLGCAFPQASLPPALDRNPATTRSPVEATRGDAAGTGTAEPRRLSVTNAPTPEPLSASNPEAQASNAGPGASESAVVNVEQMTIKAFAQFVFGNLLKKTVALDARIEQRNDLITLRTDTPQSARQVADTAKLLLQGYGITVTEFDSLVRVNAADSRVTELPLLRRGRASADTPSALRPVFHLVELEATRTGEMITWLKQMFGNRVDFQDDSNRNSILLAGPPDAVSSALEIIRALDQPRMRGRIAKRINPGYLTVAELVTRLTDLLTAQGYAVANQPAAGPTAAVMLVPVPTLNTVFLFTATQAVAEHVVRWAEEIDQAPPSAANNSFFSFPVRYSDAQSLAKTMTELMTAAAAPVAGVPGQPAATPARAPTRVVVNPATNSLIMQGGTPDDHRQWRSLLSELDKPVKSALIEVVVAEVTLGAKEQLGIEWGVVQRSVGDGRISVGTLGGLGLGTGGLAVSFLNNAGDLRGLLNFLGSSNDSKVLSSPKLLTRNAELATIQVGQEVPIVTSQQSTAGTTAPAGQTTGVLQTIQYRSTGVILRVKPIILAGGRLDLEVSQEVSSAAETRTGVTTSPTIATRRVETKLSLRDGGTVMIAGLISNTSSAGNTGIPGLRNLPGVGALFRAENKSNDKTELVILITAHILNDDFEAEAITDSFRRTLTPWLNANPEPGLVLPRTATVLGAPAAPEPKPPVGATAVPRQPDPPVLEAPRSGSGSGSGTPRLAAPETTPAAAGAAQPPGAAAPRSGNPPITGRPVTDPKLLEELNRGPK